MLAMASGAGVKMFAASAVSAAALDPSVITWTMIEYVFCQGSPVFFSTVPKKSPLGPFTTTRSPGFTDVALE